MNIEFFTPQGSISEGVINYVKEHLFKIHKQNKKISGAIVYFNEQGIKKVCEVDLSIDDDCLLVQKVADNYDMAAREALQELNKKIEEWQKLKMSSQMK
jgi:ribosome-associated translation inhibitor RaiA